MKFLGLLKSLPHSLPQAFTPACPCPTKAISFRPQVHFSQQHGLAIAVDYSHAAAPTPSTRRIVVPSVIRRLVQGVSEAELRVFRIRDFVLESPRRFPGGEK